MKKVFLLLLILIISLVCLAYQTITFNKPVEVLSAQTKVSHWLLLHRKSNIEYLYFGIPGEKNKSSLVKTFKVKTGVPGEKPTPLPMLLGREYWLITEKVETDDSETAPYFLTLDIPVTDTEPYGPTSYLECAGQCNWVLPGEFGLHGVAGDMEKLSAENPGSSGCIRHSDSDITYLSNVLKPEEGDIRYYIEDI